MTTDRSLDDLRYAAGGAALAFAILVGNLNLLPVLGYGGEVRLPATLFASLALWPLLVAVRFDQVRITVLATAGALILYFAAGALLVDGPRTEEKLVDLIYVATYLIAGAAASSDRRSMLGLAASVCGLGALYFLVTLYGFVTDDDPYSGMGWATMGTSVTFSRTMFVAFIGAFAVSTATRGWQRILLLVMSAAFLYGLLGSILKANLLAAALTIFYCLVALAYLRQWRPLVSMILVSLVAWLAFGIIHGEQMGIRIERAVKTEPLEGMADAEAPPTGALEIATRYCEFPTSHATTAVCRTKFFADQTQRLVFVAKALEQFRLSPIVGHGLGTFHIYAVNPLTLESEFFGFPHNLPAEIAAEGGLVGLLFFGLSILAVCAAALQSAAPIAVRVTLAGITLFFLIATLFGGDIYLARMIWLPGVILAFWHGGDA